MLYSSWCTDNTCLAYLACWIGARNCEMVPANLKKQPDGHSSSEICTQRSRWWPCRSSGIICQTIPFLDNYKSSKRNPARMLLFCLCVCNYRSCFCCRSLEAMPRWYFTALKRQKKGRMRTWRDDAQISPSSHGNLKLHLIQPGSSKLFTATRKTTVTMV